MRVQTRRQGKQGLAPPNVDVTSGVATVVSWPHPVRPQLAPAGGVAADVPVTPRYTRDS